MRPVSTLGFNMSKKEELPEYNSKFATENRKTQLRVIDMAQPMQEFIQDRTLEALVDSKGQNLDLSDAATTIKVCIYMIICISSVCSPFSSFPARLCAHRPYVKCCAAFTLPCFR